MGELFCECKGSLNWPANFRLLLCSTGGAAGSEKEEGAGSDADEEGPGDAKQLAAETQRVLRGAALAPSEATWLTLGSWH